MINKQTKQNDAVRSLRRKQIEMVTEKVIWKEVWQTETGRPHSGGTGNEPA